MAITRATALTNLVAIRDQMETMISETSRTLAMAIEKGDSGVTYDLRKKLVSHEGELMSFERLIVHFAKAIPTQA